MTRASFLQALCAPLAAPLAKAEKPATAPAIKTIIDAKARGYLMKSARDHPAHSYQIDARGSSIGSQIRIKDAMEMAHFWRAIEETARQVEAMRIKC